MPFASSFDTKVFEMPQGLRGHVYILNIEVAHEDNDIRCESSSTALVRQAYSVIHICREELC